MNIFGLLGLRRRDSLLFRVNRDPRASDKERDFIRGEIIITI